MIISQGDVRVFFSNWLVGSITALALVMLFWPLIGRSLARVRAMRPA
jgi:putative tricarboxylic transport membrane protein